MTCTEKKQKFAKDPPFFIFSAWHRMSKILGKWELAGRTERLDNWIIEHLSGWVANKGFWAKKTRLPVLKVVKQTMSFFWLTTFQVSSFGEKSWARRSTRKAKGFGPRDVCGEKLSVLHRRFPFEKLSISDGRNFGVDVHSNSQSIKTKKCFRKTQNLLLRFDWLTIQRFRRKNRWIFAQTANFEQKKHDRRSSK